MKKIDLSIRQKPISDTEKKFFELQYLKDAGKPYELVVKNDSEDTVDVKLFDIPNLNIANFDTNEAHSKDGINISSKTIIKVKEIKGEKELSKNSVLTYLSILKGLSKKPFKCGTVILKSKVSGIFKSSENLDMHPMQIDADFCFILKNVKPKESIHLYFYPSTS